MQVKVLERQSDTIVAPFVVCGKKVFHVSKYCLDRAPVAHSHLKDCVSKRRKRCVCVRHKVCICAIQREQMNLATHTHQSNQQSFRGVLEDQHSYRTKVSVLEIKVEASGDLFFGQCELDDYRS